MPEALTIIRLTAAAGSCIPIGGNGCPRPSNGPTRCIMRTGKTTSTELT